MRSFRVVLICVASLSLVATCSSKDKEAAKKKTPKQKPAPAINKTPAKQPSPTPVLRAPSCQRVLATRLITDGVGMMKATLNDKEIKPTYDAKAFYKNNRVWANVDTPAACGIVSPGDKMRLVAFFKDAGLPVLRIQMIGITGGEYKLDGKLRTLKGMIFSDDSHWSLQFKKGTLTVAPKTVVAGKVTVTIKGGEGIALTRGKKAKFTLDGTFTGTLAARPTVKLPKK